MAEVTIYGEHDEKTIEQARMCASTGNVTGFVLCADGHYGYSQPVGGVAVYDGQISPSGVGYDIACGNLAVRTNLKWTDVQPDIARIMDEIQAQISFGVGRVNAEPVDHRVFYDSGWEAFRTIGQHEHDLLKTLARNQLGTVGCLAGDTQVALLDGTNPTIQEIVQSWDTGNQNMWVYSYDRGTKRIVPGKILNAVKTGHVPCVRVTLDNGTQIICTADHPFLTLQEKYLRAEELTSDISIMPLYRRFRHDREEVWQPVLSYWESSHHMVVIGTQMEKYLLLLTSDAPERRRGAAQGYVIHHKDRTKRNNHPDNLEVMTPTDHNRLHHLDAKETLARLWQDPEFRRKQREASSLSAKEHWSDETKRFEKIEGMRRAFPKNPKRLEHIQELGHREKRGEDNPNYRTGKYVRNHRVVSIEPVGGFDVFDLTIDRFHNFALSAGVFVHNSGNHYVDIFVEPDTDDVWAGVHFGSRGFGHKTASGFLNLAAGREFFGKAPGEKMDQPPTLLNVDTELGDMYIKAMELAGRYAYAGRDYVVNKVLSILGAEETFSVHNHHNYAWLEDGKWVVRKGATPNAPGQQGFIGGSMCDMAVIVEGLDTSENERTFHSTVHGAGRVMSRTQAAGKMNYKTRTRSGGQITQAQMDESVKGYGIELRGAGADESEFVYRKLADVLEYHKDTIKILHTLRPIGVCMAGGDEFDPYKD